jgi:serine phosphatase RsbU (regulator of sigma subunit)
MVNDDLAGNGRFRRDPLATGHHGINLRGLLVGRKVRFEEPAANGAIVRGNPNACGPSGAPDHVLPRGVPRVKVESEVYKLVRLAALDVLQFPVPGRGFCDLLDFGEMFVNPGAKVTRLARRIEEVEALSDQVVAQMTQAHEHELRQRLLEAENARKSAELEAARALQLSMLPTALPEVAGLDVAVAMSTASEVGGDYYDFRNAAADCLVVAVGDATGHGVAAGTMVTAVKALFTTLSGEPRLATILGECDRVLRGMNVKPLHMCLVLGRVTSHGLALCAAGMPPVLVWRASTGTVEELGAGGLPLGSHLSPRHEERSAPLASGDTVLFATDGFSEQLDSDGQPLGFDGASHAFAGACGGSAREVVDRLTATVTSWRGAREQTDDITFVVIRVTS